MNKTHINSLIKRLYEHYITSKEMKYLKYVLTKDINLFLFKNSHANLLNNVIWFDISKMNKLQLTYYSWPLFHIFQFFNNKNIDSQLIWNDLIFWRKYLPYVDVNWVVGMNYDFLELLWKLMRLGKWRFIYFSNILYGL